MGYIEQANLAADAEFQRRLAAATAQEAKPKPQDDNFANAILRSPEEGSRMFTPFVVAEPGFDVEQSQISDAMILSAIQANWARVSGVYFPPATAPQP